MRADSPSRILFENAAHGQQLSWNTDIDYREFFENGNEFFQRAVRQLYREAGLYALDFWKAPGRNVRSNPKIPLLRMHEVGDSQVPLSLVQGYEALVHANGKGDLFRTAFVNAASHCGFNAAETGTAVELMMRRLDTGRWESTDPAQLGRVAESLSLGVKSRFTSADLYRQVKYNRAWIPE